MEEAGLNHVEAKQEFEGLQFKKVEPQQQPVEPQTEIGLAGMKLMVTVN